MKKKITKVESLKKKIIIKLFMNARKRKISRKPLTTALEKTLKSVKKVKIIRKNYIKQNTKNKLFFKLNKMVNGYNKNANFSRVLYNPKGCYLQPKMLFFSLLQKNPKNRRLLFKKKPYNYKEKKFKTKQWAFRLKRKLKRTNAISLQKASRIGSKSKKGLQQLETIKKTTLLKKVGANASVIRKKKLLLYALRKKSLIKPLDYKKHTPRGLKSSSLSNLWNNKQIIVSSLLHQPIVMTKGGLKAMRKKIKTKLKMRSGGYKNNRKIIKNQTGFKYKKNRGFKPFFDIVGLR